VTQQIIMQRDTQGWRTQVWISFGSAFLASSIGVLLLPGEQLDRAFLAIGFFFCLFSVFAVSKMVRDNRDGQVDTPGWVATVWVAFGSAIVLTAWGLWRMNIPEWQKGYMAVSWLFLVSSAFTLAKALRDAHEAELMDRGAASAIADEPKSS
jgi:hypothetical protein